MYIRSLLSTTISKSFQPVHIYSSHINRNSTSKKEKNIRKLNVFNRTEHISILFLSHSREFLDPRMVEWLVPKTVYKFSDRPRDRDSRNLWF